MKGVLLMAYGSPATMNDVEDYYTHIRGGKKPSAEQLKDLEDRYKAIGGPSPLLAITQRQAAGLQSALMDEGSETMVFAGMKHSRPFVGEVARNAESQGVTELLCIALAPHYSKMSIGGYHRAVEEGISATNRVRVSFVKSWHDRTELITLWSDRVRRAAEGLGPDFALVFSAHSLPSMILTEGDPYKDQLLESSSLIAGRAGVHAWSFSFQSASMTGEPWLGPDIVDHLDSLRLKGGKEFLIAPIGFVSDHLEILYDIDVECAAWAARSGVTLRRCESPNDSNEFIGCLLSLVRENGFV